jgi:hypothetical protein
MRRRWGGEILIPMLVPIPMLMMTSTMMRRMRA